jgi:hypothetical protein
VKTVWVKVHDRTTVSAVRKIPSASEWLGDFSAGISAAMQMKLATTAETTRSRITQSPSSLSAAWSWQSSTVEPWIIHMMALT